MHQYVGLQTVLVTYFLFGKIIRDLSLSGKEQYQQGWSRLGVVQQLIYFRDVLFQQGGKTILSCCDVFKFLHLFSKVIVYVLLWPLNSFCDVRCV